MRCLKIILNKKKKKNGKSFDRGAIYIHYRIANCYTIDVFNFIINVKLVVVLEYSRRKIVG